MRPRVGLGHQSFADQKCPDPRSLHLFHDFVEWERPDQLVQVGRCDRVFAVRPFVAARGGLLRADVAPGPTERQMGGKRTRLGWKPEVGTGRVNFPKVLDRLWRGGFKGGPLVIECLAPGELPQLLAEAKKARAFVESLVA